MSAVLTKKPQATCPRGHINSADARFCSQCGQRLGEAGALPALLQPALPLDLVGQPERPDQPQPARSLPPAQKWFHSRSLSGRVWEFFASVRVAIVIIFVLAVASIAGTLIEQEGQYSSWMRPEDYYPFRYGAVWGPLLFKVGFTRMYTSWWFIGLLLILALSLVVCSIDRFVPLWKLVRRPPVAVSAGFIRRQRHQAEWTPAAPGLNGAAAVLRRGGYRVQAEGQNLFADKGRWNRWGPYITHIGILIILLAGIARVVPAWYFDTTISVQDGQTVRVPNTDFAVRSEGFQSAFYPDGRPKMYATDAVIIADGQEVKGQRIEVNRPLTYRQVSLFQSSYQTVLGTANIEVVERDGGRSVGVFSVDLEHPDPEYQVGDLRVVVRDYFPDFALDPGNRPVSRSGVPNNPGFRLEINGPGITTPSPQWFFVQFPELEGHGAESPYRFWLAGIQPRSTSVLRVKKDLGVSLVYAGSLVAMIGLLLTFYLSHRRIWVLETDSRMLVGGDSLRQQSFFRREFERIASRLQSPEGSDT